MAAAGRAGPVGLRRGPRPPHRTLAANQGLYNGFLAAGLIWSLIIDSLATQVFFLVCVIVAGVYGAATANRRILIAQALPGALALGAALLAA